MIFHRISWAIAVLSLSLATESYASNEWCSRVDADGHYTITEGDLEVVGTVSRKRNSQQCIEMYFLRFSTYISPDFYYYFNVLQLKKIPDQVSY